MRAGPDGGSERPRAPLLGAGAGWKLGLLALFLIGPFAARALLRPLEPWVDRLLGALFG